MHTAMSTLLFPCEFFSSRHVQEALCRADRRVFHLVSRRSFPSYGTSSPLTGLAGC